MDAIRSSFQWMILLQIKYAYLDESVRDCFRFQASHACYSVISNCRNKILIAVKSAQFTSKKCIFDQGEHTTFIVGILEGFFLALSLVHRSKLSFHFLVSVQLSYIAW